MNEVKFSSLTAEAKYHILNYLSENGDVPHSCFKITQAVQQQNEAMIITVRRSRLSSKVRAIVPVLQSHFDFACLLWTY